MILSFYILYYSNKKIQNMHIIQQILNFVLRYLANSCRYVKIISQKNKFKILLSY